MAGHSTYEPQHPAAKWLESRLPIIACSRAGDDFPTPKNLNYWWTFGGILAVMLVVQIITGIVLVMHYAPNVLIAFSGVEGIMRDVNYGWLLRYLHSNGASMFFIAVYIHIFRGLYFGSYKEPRGSVDPRRDHLPSDDGDRLHGLRAALGSDVVLGRHGHHQPLLGDSVWSVRRS